VSRRQSGEEAQVGPVRYQTETRHIRAEFRTKRRFECW